MKNFLALIQALHQACFSHTPKHLLLQEENPHPNKINLLILYIYHYFQKFERVSCLVPINNFSASIFISLLIVRHCIHEAGMLGTP